MENKSGRLKIVAKNFISKRMSHSKPVKPKRKRRIYATKEAPFPVPIGTVRHEVASPNHWFYYTGYLEGDHVIVKHSGDMDYLSKMGFFGKGMLSRSHPDFNKRSRVAHIPEEDGNVRSTQVTSRRSYLRRLHWSNKIEEICEEYDSSQEIGEENVEECGEDDTKTGRSPSDPEEMSAGEQHQEDEIMSEDDTDSQNTGYVMEEHENGTGRVDSWENTEGDADFWGSSSSNGAVPTMSSWAEGDKGKTPLTPGPREAELHTHPGCGKEPKTLKEGDSAMFTERKVKRDIPNMPENVRNSAMSTTADNSMNFSEKYNLSATGSEEVNKHVTDDHDIGQHAGTDMHDEREPGKVSDSDIISTSTCASSTQFSDMHKQKTTANQQNETKDKVLKNYDKRSLFDEEEGTLFVVDDSDSDSEVKKRKYSELQWKPVVKKDPYPVKEDLHLMFEEACFLAYGLGCLIVYSKDEKMSLENMWRTFSERRPSFLPNYIAYHYYRSKGWVPKSGLKFGSDLIIYKEGPAFYHSSYSVIVKMVDMETLQECKDYPQRNMDWTRLSGLNRVTEHVAKELLFCYVLKPAFLSSDDLNSPGCISHFKIKEHTVSRWVSSQERENKHTDIP